MLTWFLILGVMFSIAGMIAGHYVWRIPQQAEEERLGARMRELRSRAAGLRQRQGVDLIRQESQGQFAFFANFLQWMKPLQRLQELIGQANLTYQATDVFTVSIIILIVMFGLLGLVGVGNPFLKLAIAAACAAIPTVYILNKRSARLHKFETQLPDAIDLFSRSMKAGHNIQGGLETIASETIDPVQMEFKKVMEELALGSPTEEALHKLGERVPLIDLKFFITGLILQRQTGANMGDMLENLATLIRERLDLAEQLKAGTASQRMSAGLVCSIPVVMFLIYLFLKPEYAILLLEDPTGNMILYGAMALELIGIALIWKIANPKF
jgi:tight adherence protein B